MATIVCPRLGAPKIFRNRTTDRSALRRRRYDWSWHASALRGPLASVAAGLYPFVNQGKVDVRGGHHDAGDYSKYTINSSGFIHDLVLAAASDSLEGAVRQSSEIFSAGEKYAVMLQCSCVCVSDPHVIGAPSQRSAFPLPACRAIKWATCCRSWVTSDRLRLRTLARFWREPWRRNSTSTHSGAWALQRRWAIPTFVGNVVCK